MSLIEQLEQDALLEDYPDSYHEEEEVLEDEISDYWYYYGDGWAS